MHCEDLSNFSQRLRLSSGKNNIIFCGFQGVGKTTLGQKVADDLSLQFVDTDACIEDRYKVSCHILHRQEGELKFRLIEEEVISSLKKIKNAVISLGGGVPLSIKNRILLREIGVVIYLTCSEKTLVKSLMERKPFPSYIDSEEAIRELFRIRDPIYREFADEQK
jgi:shikimate kinase